MGSISVVDEGAREATEPAGRMRVLVAEDHPVFLDGLARAIERRDELVLVAQAGDGRSALALVQEHQPDVALLDLRLPGLTGLQVLAAIVRDTLPTRVLMLSAESSGPQVFEAVRIGAAGYLSKSADRTTICDAIVAVAQGAVVLAPEVQGDLVAELRLRHDDHRRLSPREAEILRMVADGLSAPRIGERLHLSAATVKSHLQNLYEKLGVSERAAAVAEGMRRGLID